jgi:hypothetical protein
MRGGVNVAGAVFTAVLAASPAQAQTEPCGTAERPWVELSGSRAELIEFERLLRAELGTRHIDLCPDAGEHGAAAVATVTISAHLDGASIVVEVRDRLTAKRVARDLDLAGVPEDGRSLMLAVVADELLRASWAELALASAPAPAMPVPAAVTEIVQQGFAAKSPIPTPGPTAGIEAVVAIEHWAGTGTLIGADLRIDVGSASRFGAGLRLGARGAPAALAPDGQVHTTALLGGVSASFRATPAISRYGLDAIVRLDVARISYVALPNPGASGNAQAETTALAGAGMDGWIGLGSATRLLGEVLVNAPLRPVVADDGGRQVTAVSGAGIEGGLGIRVAF